MADRKRRRDTARGGKSLIRAALLSAVVEKPGHGWDVARRARQRLGAIWKLDSKHVYPYLDQLEEEGLIQLSRERMDTPPYGRKVYSSTEEGLRVRAEWFASPPANNRNDLNMRLAFSGESDIPSLLRALAERNAEIMKEVEGLAMDDTARVSFVGTIISLQRSSVIRRLNAELDWIREATRDLEAWLERRS